MWLWVASFRCLVEGCLECDYFHWECQHNLVNTEPCGGRPEPLSGMLGCCWTALQLLVPSGTSSVQGQDDTCFRGQLPPTPERHTGVTGAAGGPPSLQTPQGIPGQQSSPRESPAPPQGPTRATSAPPPPGNTGKRDNLGQPEAHFRPRGSSVLAPVFSRGGAGGFGEIRRSAPD